MAYVGQNVQPVTGSVEINDAVGNTINPATDDAQQDMILLLTRMLNYLNAPQGYDKSLQRQRSTVIVESGTVSAVSTVSSVTNQVNVGGIQGQILVNADNLSAWALTVRSRIT